MRIRIATEPVDATVEDERLGLRWKVRVRPTSARLAAAGREIAKRTGHTYVTAMACLCLAEVVSTDGTEKPAPDPWPAAGQTCDPAEAATWTEEQRLAFFDGHDDLGNAIFLAARAAALAVEEERGN